MNIWDILETEPTKDKDALKRAYRKKLIRTNPEDDPEGFQILRGAYEDALRLAEQPDEEEENDERSSLSEGNIGSGTGNHLSDNDNDTSIIGRLKKMYSDLSTRTDEALWENFLQESYFLSPDTSEEGLHLLLNFIAEHYRLTPEVYRVICRTYNLAERRRELSEYFPSELIRFMIQKAESDGLIDYKTIQVEPGTDPDVLLEKMERLERKVRENDTEAVGKMLPELLEKIQAGKIVCPPAEICEVRYYQQKGEIEKAKEMAGALFEKYPDNADVMVVYADTRMDDDDPKEILAVYEKVLKIRPNSVLVKTRCAEVRFLMGEFEKARDQYFDLLKKDPYNNYVREGAIQACEEIIRTKGELLEKLRKERENSGEEISEEEKAAVIDSAIALYQSYRFDEAIEMFESIPSEGKREADYFAYLGRSYLAKEEAETALLYLLKWKEVLEKMPEDGLTPEEEKIKKRYPYVLYLIGSAHMLMNHFEEARKYMDWSGRYHFEEKIALLEGSVELEFREGRYKECIEACEQLEAEYPGNYVSFLFRAKAFYKIGLYQEAVNYANETTVIYPFIIEPYYVMMKIFYSNKQYDDEERIIREYEQFGFDSVTVKMERARLLFKRDNDPKEAYKLLKACSFEEKTDLEEPEQYYLLLGEVCEAKMLPQEAEEAYLKAKELQGSLEKINLKIGILYKKMGRMQEAIECFSEELSIEHDALAFLMRGECYFQIREYEKAGLDTEYAIRIAPRTVSFYISAADLFQRMLKYQMALRTFSEAFSMTEDERVQNNILTDIIRCEIYLGQFHSALSRLERLAKHKGFRQFVLECLFEIDMRRGKNEDALEKLQTQNWDKSKVPETRKKYYNSLIYLSCRIGDLKKAEECLKESIGKKCDSYEQYVSIGRLYLASKKYSKAEEAFSHAAEKEEMKRIILLPLMAEAAGHQLGGASRMKRYLRMMETQVIAEGIPAYEYELAEVRRLRLSKDIDVAKCKIDEILSSVDGGKMVNDTMLELLTERALCLVEEASETEKAEEILQQVLICGGRDKVVELLLADIRKKK